MPMNLVAPKKFLMWVINNVNLWRKLWLWKSFNCVKLFRGFNEYLTARREICLTPQRVANGLKVLNRFHRFFEFLRPRKFTSFNFMKISNDYFFLIFSFPLKMRKQFRSTFLKDWKHLKIFTFEFLKNFC